MAGIKITTDSAADIPVELQKELDIQVLPFPIAMGDREYADGVDFTPDQFYKALLAAPQIPTHAQLNPYQFTQLFEGAWKAGYSHLIHVSINSKGSATYGNALQARDEFYEDHPEARDTFSISLLDSRTYTMCYGWAVIQGARMAASGAPAEEVLDFLRDWLDHARILFTPQQISRNRGIYKIIKLLKQISKKKRHGKTQQKRGRTSLRHVHRLTFLFQIHNNFPP